MMDGSLRARLLNADGELIAEGPCRVDEAAGLATLEPERETGVIQKERGVLTLELDTGRTLRVSDRPMIFRLWPPHRAAGQPRDGCRTLYRLRLIRQAETSSSPRPEARPEGSVETLVEAQPELVEGAQEAAAAGAAREGLPADGAGAPAAPAGPAGGR